MIGAMPSTSRQRAPALGKLSPPRLGRVFERQRLFEQLDTVAGSPAVWIVGPPGIGKTTLVATYQAARNSTCLWLQLDAGDADPATFVHFVRQAAVASARRAPRMPVPTADDLRDVPGLVRRCLRQIALAIEGPWVLVLDNVHALGDATPLHAGIAAALAELPAHARVVAISREAPPGAYARTLATQQLGVLDAAALTFTEEETGRLVRLHERDWSAAALREATQGWAAAMILLLAARAELGPADTLRSGVTRDRLFGYFAGEVMAQWPASVAHTLMCVAFLPSATDAMAIAVSGDPQAPEHLDAMARRSLFTERRGAPAAYTYHALFGEFLRARAAESLDAVALRALQLRAANVLASHAHADAAVAQLLAVAEWDAALALLLAEAPGLVAQGRAIMLRGALLAVPAAARDDPGAWYWLGHCELALDPALSLQHLERAHHGFVRRGDVQGSFFAAAAAADAIVFVGANLDALAPWMPVLELHAPGYLAQHDLELDLRVLPGLLAAFVHREPAHALTATLADRAERLIDQPLGASQRILLGSLAYYLLWTGQTLRLERVMLKIDRLCTGQAVAPGTLLRWYGVGVLIRSLLGDVDAALAQAGRALDLVGAGPAPMRIKAELMMVLAAVAARDRERARQHLDCAATLLDTGSPIDATTYEFQRGILMLLDADWDSAARLMRAAVITGRASGWPLREHIALLGQALAATQVGAFDEAEAALQAALLHRFHAVCRWHHWIAALVEAELADRRGDRPRCLSALARAFATARELGVDFGPLPYGCGDMMSRLASLALRHDIDRPFVHRIVQRHRLPAPAGADEHWPWPLRVHTLGRFMIEREGPASPASRKESRKPLELLKLLIAFGGVAVPVPRLVAALWPDAEGDAARNSFDNTLHRLRKRLGGEHHVPLSSAALSLNPSTCWTDVGALMTCLDEVDDLSSRPDPVTASALLERALALYQGDFLAGDEDLPDVLVARDRLQARFTRLMGGLGQRLEQIGQHGAAARLYQRVLEQQPLAEDTYRRLIACLLQLGQRAEAYAVYRRCRQQLSVVLGLRPAAETDALVAGLRDL
jgi:LuxR family transcriptional regulator, maltose regulon positive regulatory protein